MPKSKAPKPQTLIAVDDVLRSTAWYCDLLDLRPLSTSYEETHGNLYNRLYHGEELLLQLHAWDEEGHPNLVDRGKGPPGHGVLIWFEVSDFEDAVRRAGACGAEIVREPALNTESGEHEVWLRDPDGYTVVLSGRPRPSV